MRRLVRHSGMGFFRSFILMSLVMMWGMNMMDPPEISAQEQNVLHYYDKLLDVILLEGGQIWAVGHDGKLIHSGNFGKDWVSQDAGVSKGLFSVFFISPEKGWISGEQGLILNTQDGGKTWTAQGEGISDQSLVMIKFINENVGWAVGSFGTVLRTQDGGANWKRSAFQEDKAFNDIYFFNENKGYAACEFDSVMMTEDGGESWKPQTEPGFGDIGNFFGVTFIDENRGFVVGTGGNIKYTLNGGAEWKQAENNEEKKSTLIKVRFFNDRQGVAVGLDGAMVFTKDGGVSWYPPSPITQFTWFSGLSVLNDGRGVVVGIGNILVTDDFGKNWVNPFGEMTR